MQNYVIKFWGAFLIFFIFTGCVTQPQLGCFAALGRKKRQGVFHIVQKGQTLWTIARTYKVSVHKICSDNHLKTGSRIKAGQKLWIAGARRALSVPVTCSSQAPPSFCWPLRGRIIRRFGRNGLEHYDGIDIQAPAGTLVRAAASGRVIYANSKFKGYGQVIIVQHKGGYTTVYAHNQENLVKVNNIVRAGEAIARIGRSAEEGTAYLHFEIRYREKAFDPMTYLP